MASSTKIAAASPTAEWASCPVAEAQEARVRWVEPVRKASETTL